MSRPKVYVRCDRCEADVEVTPEWQAPTWPTPSVPSMPLHILLRELGHECQLPDIVKVLERSGARREQAS